MRVLLVTSPNPNYSAYYAKAYTNLPKGLLYLASYLEQLGHEVKVYDGFVDERKPEDFLDFNPQLIGFSVITGPNLEGAILQSKQFRALFPAVPIVWGNVHTSVLPKQTLSEPYIDYVVIGAGEYTLAELIDYLEKGDRKLNDIKGLGFKIDGQMVLNDPRPFIKDLEALPDPAWHLVPVKKYSMIGINTSRGCVHRCAFCYNKAYNKGYIGYLSAERIISQIEFLRQHYEAKYIRFDEDNFTFNRKRLREFCNLLIERKIKISWNCDSRADLSDADVTLMAKAGCVAVGLGLESGSQRGLDFMQKDITVPEMERTFWSLVKHKIRTSVYIIYGYPTETVEDFNATHEMLKRLDNPYYMYNRFVPFPGSALYDYCVAQGMVTPPARLDDWPEFLIEYANKINLSHVPTEMMTEAAANWRANYAAQRIRFTLKHNPEYFLTLFKNPLKFLREVGELIKFHGQVNKFYKTVQRTLSGFSSSSQDSGLPLGIAPKPKVI
ncbi:radical SAM protein [Dehalogenimonas sp. 4OHTPN]|uniref:Radical SAM protein n=1 Tax=Dehalogenimonas sp. 4OHTPN TaxID=3166643 RepID=A0AAU8G7W8_9CHLR